MHRHPDEIYTATEIALAVDVTYPFFIKVANMLKKHGLVSSVQGRNGGYALGKPAAEISLYDVYLCTEGELYMSRCLQSQPCAKGKEDNCKLHTFLGTVQKDVIDKMSTQSIADLAG